MRSRAAASVLGTAGFRNVASMAGGIKAWQGLTAAGLPEAGMAFFTGAADAGELIALAWLLEEGSRKFYTEVADIHSEPGSAGLFDDLVKAEEHHKGTLQSLFRDVTGREPGPDFPLGMPVAKEPGTRMEGNVAVAEALAWAKDRTLQDLLELCMALETDSYDLYIKMSRTVPGEQAQEVFTRLAAEEKEHLARMAKLLDHGLGGE
ncbi:MAG: ferritin family protein [Thermodesulfovibrionales bacterium]